MRTTLPALESKAVFELVNLDYAILAMFWNNSEVGRPWST